MAGANTRFTVGSRVIYPSHGVAEIVRREKRSFGGEDVSYLVLVLPDRGTGSSQAGMVLSVPEEGAAALGVRVAVSSDEAEGVLELLEDHDIRVPTMWSRRFKNHQEKLRTGDIYQCAEVVRNLAVRSRQHPMSAGEQSMYGDARGLLISELAISWGIDDDEAEQRVDRALAPRTPVEA